MSDVQGQDSKLEPEEMVVPAVRPLLLAFLQWPQIGPNKGRLRWPTLYMSPEGIKLPLGPWVVTWLF